MMGGVVIDQKLILGSGDDEMVILPHKLNLRDNAGVVRGRG